MEVLVRNYISAVLFLLAVLNPTQGADDDYNVVHKDGSFEFGYETPDSYHHADANRNNVVRGEFGGRNPSTGAIDSTVYTAGPRGYRPRGKNIHRKYDLNQNGPRPIGSRDDPYYDPFEDPSYNFGFRTKTYSRQENANRVGDVTGKYTYVDDVGERHNVEYIAGKNTGFHVKTPFPDSNPRAYGPLYFAGRGKHPRGRTSIQRGLDGSYRFVSAGPDQRRTETSDASGHVRGSYTYLDDKGVQHAVHYIAGPETGYRVLKNVKGPHLPTVFPFGNPSILPPDFYDDYIKDNDVFDTAASGHVKPTPTKPNTPGKDETGDNLAGGIDVNKDDFDKFESDVGKPSSGGSRPPPPTYDEEDGDSDDFGDLFGGGPSNKPSSVSKPSGSGDSSFKPTGNGPFKPSGNGPYKPSGNGPFKPSESDLFKPSGSDGSYIPPGDPDQDDGKYRPELHGEAPRPGLGGDGSASVRPPRPSYGDDYDDGSDLSLFGSESSRPTLGGRPSVIQVQGNGCENCRGTIVTNVGDRLFTVPPGVSVRAHVQSIDLLPLVSKVPSPSEQYKEDSSIKTEQLNSASSDLVGNATETETTTVVASTTSTVPTTIIPTTTASTTTIST